jgi:hypothetical protein
MGPAPRRAPLVLWGAQVMCTRGIFIFNEIWAQDKLYILVGTLLGFNALSLSTGTGS